MIKISTSMDKGIDLEIYGSNIEIVNDMGNIIASVYRILRRRKIPKKTSLKLMSIVMDKIRNGMFDNVEEEFKIVE